MNNKIFEIIEVPLYRFYKRYKDKFQSRIHKLTKREHIYLLGDSHLEVFNHINEKKIFKNTYLHTIIVPGATSLGLKNPNSKTGALKIFKKEISHIKHKKTDIFFMLGEVDCGFAIWYRAKKYGEEVMPHFYTSIENYQSFILEIKNIGFQNITILGAPPPTIFDNIKIKGNVAKIREDVSANILQRTQLTAKYNGLMEEFCKHNKIKFFSINREIIDKETQIVSPYYLNENPLDHHLNSKKIYQYYVNHIKEINQKYT